MYVGSHPGIARLLQQSFDLHRFVFAKRPSISLPLAARPETAILDSAISSPLNQSSPFQSLLKAV
jgi:hypothetical protein